MLDQLAADDADMQDDIDFQLESQSQSILKPKRKPSAAASICNAVTGVLHFNEGIVFHVCCGSLNLRYEIDILLADKAADESAASDNDDDYLEMPDELLKGRCANGEPEKLPQRKFRKRRDVAATSFLLSASQSAPLFDDGLGCVMYITPSCFRGIALHDAVTDSQ